MTDTPPLRERIAIAIREKAYDCCDITSPSGCRLTDSECLAQHPVRIAAWYEDGTVIGAVHGDAEALADLALAVVQPELDQARAASLRDAATRLRRHCPDHGNAPTPRFDGCHCPAADQLDHDADTYTTS